MSEPECDRSNNAQLTLNSGNSIATASPRSPPPPRMPPLGWESPWSNCCRSESCSSFPLSAGAETSHIEVGDGIAFHSIEVGETRKQQPDFGSSLSLRRRRSLPSRARSRMHDALPLVTDLSRCANAVPKIFTQEDIPRWLASEAYRLLHTFITRLNAAVHGKTIHEPCVESNVILHLFLPQNRFLTPFTTGCAPDRRQSRSHERLDRPDSTSDFSSAIWQQSISRLDSENGTSQSIPCPIASRTETTTQRTSNQRKRRSFPLNSTQSFLNSSTTFAPPSAQLHDSTTAQATSYPSSPTSLFYDSLGSSPKRTNKRSLLEFSLRILIWSGGFSPCIDWSRRGVREFGDWTTISIWSTSGEHRSSRVNLYNPILRLRLILSPSAHPTLRPISVLTPSLIEPEASSYLFLSSILHIRQLKTGPFAEHSPMLNNIASTVPNWTKVNTGLLKMYEEEVLKKVPVVQHFWFGGLLAWRSVGTGEVMESSGDGKEVVDEVVEGEVKMEGTKAPWATDSSAIPSQPLRLPTTTLQSTRRTAPSYTASRAPQSFNPPPLFPPTSARSGSAIRQYSTLAESGSAAASSSPFGSLPPPTLHSASKREGLPWERK